MYHLVNAGHQSIRKNLAMLLNADKALTLILKSVTGLSAEKVKLREALGRTLARDIVARENIPPFDNSSMDGYAVLSSNLSSASKRKPVVLSLAGEASAGHVFRRKLQKGQAVRIMTGGKIPEGADAVVPVEIVEELDDKRIRLVSPVKSGANIRRAGEDIKKASLALRRGDVITPGRVGVLAALGYTKVHVTRKPKVNILATGNELVPVREKPKEGQIRNSSSPMLRAYVELAGGDARFLGIVGDKKKQLRKALAASLDADVVLVTGGVSVGKYDMVKDVLRDLGVRIKFWRVNIKPGKPLLFGTFGKTLVFGLPGNPASTGVTFLQFVRPALYAMLGRTAVKPQRMTAILDEPIAKRDAKRHFVRAVAAPINGVLHVKTTGSQSSGMVSSLAKANCLIIIPENLSTLKKGSTVEIEMME